MAQLIIYFICIVFAIAAGFAGNQPWFRIERITRSVFLNGLLFLILIFTILMMAWFFGYFPHWIAAPFMMVLYSTLAGFFTGYAFRLYQLKKKNGKILYSHRSFWIDHAPNFLAIIIILFGLYRTSIFLDDPVTGIRVTSGLSLICFGIFGWTLKIVPEFRSGGIILLDQAIQWSQLLAWRWVSEDVVQLEYLHQPGSESEQIRIFQTSIPQDDRVRIESVLKTGIENSTEERKKLQNIETDHQ